jgi:hypothetical protein
LTADPYAGVLPGLARATAEAAAAHADCAAKARQGRIHSWAEQLTAAPHLPTGIAPLY